MSTPKTAVEILHQEFDKVVAAHPQENWVKFEEDNISIQIGTNAMQEYAAQQSRERQ